MRVRKSPQNPLLQQLTSGGPKSNISFSVIAGFENQQFANSRSAIPRKFVLHSPEELISQSATKMFSFNSLPPISKDQKNQVRAVSMDRKKATTPLESRHEAEQLPLSEKNSQKNQHQEELDVLRNNKKGLFPILKTTTPGNSNENSSNLNKTNIVESTSLNNKSFVHTPLTARLRPKESAGAKVEQSQHVRSKSQNYDKSSSAGDDKAKTVSLYELDSHPYRHLIFSPEISKKDFKQHLLLVYKGLKYSKFILKEPSQSFLETKKIFFGDRELNSKVKTIILDLDETLVHATHNIVEADQIISTKDDKGKPVKIYVKIRPFVMELIKTLKKHYEIVVFSAAAKYYAESIVRHIDPQKQFISYVLSREYCLETKNGFFIKDLRIIANRNLKNLLIVDNLVHSFGFQLDNGIPILEWRGNPEDCELKYLTDYLIGAALKTDNLQAFNKEKLKLTEMSEQQIESLMLIK